jgi:hypothetical protein
MATPESPDETLTRAEREALLGALSPGDWERAFSMARLLAAGLADLGPDDLVGEVVTDLLSCVRTWRRGVHPLVTLKVAMHSVASNTRKKAAMAPIDRFATVSTGVDEEADGDLLPIHAVDERTPEDAVDARLQLARIEKLVKGDDDAELVLMAWAIGIRGVEAQKEAGLDAKRYDAARQRLLRKLKLVAEVRNTK